MCRNLYLRLFKVILLSFLSCSVLFVSAQETRDSVKIYFHKGRTEIDLSLREVVREDQPPDIGIQAGHGFLYLQDYGGRCGVPRGEHRTEQAFV